MDCRDARVLRGDSPRPIYVSGQGWQAYELCLLRLCRFQSSCLRLYVGDKSVNGYTETFVLLDGCGKQESNCWAFKPWFLLRTGAVNRITARQRVAMSKTYQTSLEQRLLEAGKDSIMTSIRRHQMRQTRGEVAPSQRAYNFDTSPCVETTTWLFPHSTSSPPFHSPQSPSPRPPSSHWAPCHLFSICVPRIDAIARLGGVP